MEPVLIEVRPCAGRAGYFEASIPRASGLLCVSRQPLLDGARVLLSQGIDPARLLVMRHAGSDVDALRSTAGAAAKLTVKTSGNGAPAFSVHEPASSAPAPPSDFHEQAATGLDEET